MSLLFRYVLWRYLAAVGALLAGLVAIYLVIDFVDRARVYSERATSVWHVAELYGWKSLTVLHELLPAALLLAGGSVVTRLRGTGELVAMRAVRQGPSGTYLPIALAALLVASGAVALDERVVTQASRAVDDINSRRNFRWGDWRLFFTPQTWYRLGSKVLYVRGGRDGASYRDVTLLEPGTDFVLQQRIDASRLSPLPDGAWLLERARVRDFTPDGASTVRHEDRLRLALEAPSERMVVKVGRPEQMRLTELREQIETREGVGLGARRFRIALHERFAHPLAGVPGALLAAALAARRLGRSSARLSGALVEGLGVTLALWAAKVVAQAFAMAERITPAQAAWAPVVLLTTLAMWLWFVQERGGAGWERT